MSNKIKSIDALEILDSRGNPTVRVTVKLKNGIKAQASVPSGASTGIHEAWELRDKDKKRYGGKGVLKAVNNVNKKILNGGAHAGFILDFQEFMVVPLQRKFKERVRCGSEIFHALQKELKIKGFSTLVGDEGGYAVALKSNEEALQYIVKAIKRAGYKAGKEVKIAMDPAVSEIYNKKTKLYNLKLDGKKLNADQMIDLFSDWSKKYPILSLEDALDQDDWEGWTRLNKRLGKKLVLVGDDFFVTNVKRLQKGIDEKCANAILIKVNQIGSLSEAIDTILLAQENKYKISVSHRSGETADTFIADLAVAVNAEFIKTGSLSRSERVAKYNRLMEIEEEIK